jgi:phosphate transport system permease protein
MREEQLKLGADLAAEDTTLDLGGELGYVFNEGMLIRVDREVMRVTGVDATSLTVERGVNDTTAAAHSAGDETIEIAEEVTLGEFITGIEWQPQIGAFGIWPLLTATLITSAIALLVAIPLGMGAAIYLSEYAPRNVRNTLKPVLEILAGVPTVVYGFFALTFVTPGLQWLIGPRVEFYNMLSAGLVMGVLIVPLVSSLAEDALSAVPRALREASYGLGATRLETTVQVVLPAAVSGILSAIILAMSRAVGETMIVAIAAGAGPSFTFNIFTGAETMTGHIARISGGDLSYNSIDYNSIFAIGMMLFLLTLTLNLISGWVARRLREAY